MVEARLEDSGAGLAPAGEGWFVVNVRDAEWVTSDTFGSGCVFESRDAWFPQLGINIAVMEPGQPNCLYPVSELAGRYGASVGKETPDPGEAYAPFERPQPGKPPY